MLKNENESKRPPLFFLGLIAASALSLTALSWRYPTENHVVDPPFLDEGEMIEIDWDRIVIERKSTATTTQASSTSQQRTIVASDEIRTVPDRIGEERRPISLINTITPKDRAPKTLATTKNTGPLGIRELSVQEMPYLRNCGEVADAAARFQCTQQGLRSHIGENLNISSFKRKDDISGRVVVTFTIDSYGNISDIKTDKDIDPALEEEIERVFKSMPEIVPATRAGERVSVRFEIPVSILIH